MVKKPRKGPPKGSTQTIRLDIQYDGTNYVGWQIQPKGDSIQGVLTRALNTVASEKVTLFGASRTDAGVHARQQVASFSLSNSRAPIHAFLHGTNSILPPDIRVTKAEVVDFMFLANSEVKEKIYRYFLNYAPIPDPFRRHFAWHWKGKLDFNLMNEAAQLLVGEHDFAAFQSSNTDTQTTIRTVTSARWNGDEKEFPFFEIKGNGFLKYMVRGLVGTLLDVGQGNRKPKDIQKIIETRKRTEAGMNAPPHGLFLWEVLF